jgi:hypothetical protein
MNKQNPDAPSGDHTNVYVGKDVSDSVIVTGNGNVINVGNKNAAKKPRRKGKPKTKDNSNTAIIVAVIGVIGTIIAALLSSPLLGKWSGPVVPTATPTEFVTATPFIMVVTSTELPVTPPTSTLTPTPENTATASPSPEPKVDKMTAILEATKLTGKSPLRVNFDARTSYADFAVGNNATCGNNPFCSYVFTVYRDSKFEDRISNNTGLLLYTFNGKGQYFVNVYVCRGGTCEDDGVTINVK